MSIVLERPTTEDTDKGTDESLCHIVENDDSKVAFCGHELTPGEMAYELCGTAKEGWWDTPICAYCGLRRCPTCRTLAQAHP